MIPPEPRTQASRTHVNVETATTRLSMLSVIALARVSALTAVQVIPITLPRLPVRKLPMRRISLTRRLPTRRASLRTRLPITVKTRVALITPTRLPRNPSSLRRRTSLQESLMRFSAS